MRFADDHFADLAFEVRLSPTKRSSAHLFVMVEPPWRLSPPIEKTLNKKEILEIYLNSIYPAVRPGASISRHAPISASR